MIAATLVVAHILDMNVMELRCRHNRELVSAIHPAQRGVVKSGIDPVEDRLLPRCPRS
jgi:hypothetical protein